MTRISILIFLAFRGLLHRKLVFGFMISAVAFGLAFQWPNIANLSGYNKELRSRLVKQDWGDYQLRHTKKRFFTPPPILLKKLQQDKRLKQVTARIRMPGMFARVTSITDNIFEESDKPKNYGLEVLGVPQKSWEQLLNNRKNKNTPAPDLLLGSKVLETMRPSQEEKYQLILYHQEELHRIQIKSFGLAKHGYRTSVQAIMPLKKLQQMLSLGSKVTEISVTAKININRRNSFLTKAPNPYRFVPWWELVPFAESAIQGNSILAKISSFMVLIGVSIPLIALLFISVLQDKEQIALLISLGFRRLQIFFIYSLRGFLIATFGCLFGAGLGYLLLLYFKLHPIFQTANFTISPSLSFSEFLFSLLTIFFITIVSSLYPAYKASKMHPSIVFRGG